MKLTVYAEGSAKEVAEELRTVAATLDGGKAVAAEKTEKVSKKKKKEEAEEEEFDLGDAEETEEETETEEEEETEVEEEDDTTIEDVIGAFQKYAKKHSREKAAKVLAKFKVKSVRDLKPANFSQVLGLLK